MIAKSCLLIISLLLLVDINIGDFSAYWSSWINTDVPDSGDGDRESWTAGQKVAFCPNGNISRIDCVTTDGIASYSSGEIMQCTLESGSTCLNDDNFPVPCSDYKIRYFCEPPSTFSAATMELTTITEIQTFSTLSLATIDGFYATDHHTQLPTIGGSKATNNQKHNQPETKMSKSLLIGIIAGCISAVILLIAVGFCVYLSCCRKGKQKEGSVVSPSEA